MKARAKQRSVGKTAADVMPPLEEGSPLEAIANQVTPEAYARRTAHEFAVGKYSSRRTKRRYAIT